MSESLTSATLRAASALDVFYQSQTALKRFFDNWLSIPVSEYYHQTTATAAQLVYGLTMLGRWAKFTAPMTLAKPQTPMPADTSANCPNERLFRADSEYSESVGMSSSRPTPATSSPDALGQDSANRRQIVLREGSDPRLPAAVATLRAQLKAQPGLNLDVTGILSGVCSRFEEANATLRVASTDPTIWDQNLWSMSALKVKITRAKLERWAEIVAARTEALKLDDDDQDTSMNDPRGPETGQSSTDGSEAFMSTHIPSDPMETSNWNAGTPWTSDMLQGVDPSVWFDGYLDWGAVIMNSMGTLEQ